METRVIPRDDAVMLHTNLTVKGQDVMLSTTSSTLLCGYLEHMCFESCGDPEKDDTTLGDEIASVRFHHTKPTMFDDPMDAVSPEIRDLVVEHHEAAVAALKALDKGIVFSHDNSIEEVLWAIERNDFSYLK